MSLVLAFWPQMTWLESSSLAQAFPSFLPSFPQLYHRIVKTRVEKITTVELTCICPPLQLVFFKLFQFYQGHPAYWAMFMHIATRGFQIILFDMPCRQTCGDRWCPLHTPSAWHNTHLASAVCSTCKGSFWTQHKSNALSGNKNSSDDATAICMYFLRRQTQQ